MSVGDLGRSEVAQAQRVRVGAVQEDVLEVQFEALEGRGGGDRYGEEELAAGGGDLLHAQVLEGRGVEGEAAEWAQADGGGQALGREEEEDGHGLG